MYGTAPSEASVGRTFIRDIDGREVKVHLSLLDLRIGPDLEAEMTEVPSLMGLVGELLSDVTDGYQRADAEYRRWRGEQVGSILQGDPKLAEWKVKADVDASPRFLEIKHEIAAMEGDLEFLRWFMEAARVKAQQIVAKVNLTRGLPTGELPAARGSSPRLPSPTPPKDKPEDPDEKKRRNMNRMRALRRGIAQGEEAEES